MRTYEPPSQFVNTFYEFGAAVLGLKRTCTCLPRNAGCGRVFAPTNLSADSTAG
jgi:hypothetical protein